MKTHKVVTIDFDYTLAEPDELTGGLLPIPRVIDFVKQKHKEGSILHVVTFRKPEHKKEVEDFCKDYDIPIASVVCTSSQSKTSFLKELKSNLHVDDDLQTLILARLADIETLLVDWGQNVYNKIANQFPTI